MLNAHLTCSGLAGSSEHSTIGICARTTIGAAAKFPAETQPDTKMSTLSDEIILR